MARFIIIDNNSGFIFGDTADNLVGKQSDWTAKNEADILEAVQLLDGQDRETIDSVESICKYLGFVEVLA